jgi:hypothetical protein
MHVSERCERGARFPYLHSGAGDRIEHPGGYDQNLTRRSFYESDLAVGPRLKPAQSNTASKKCVPAIKNFNILPDMGRMDG